MLVKMYDGASFGLKRFWELELSLDLFVLSMSLIPLTTLLWFKEELYVSEPRSFLERDFL